MNKDALQLAMTVIRQPRGSDAGPATLTTPYRIASLGLALAYGLALALLPVDAFKDRDNYLVYATNSETILAGYSASGWLSILSNEPLWLLGNIALADVLVPEQILQLFVFLPAATVAYLVLRTEPRQFFWLLLFLLLPQVIKNHIIHLRQGVAIAVFLVAWNVTSPVWRRVLMLTTPFIHASFFFVLGLLALTEFLKKFRLATDLRLLLAVVVGVAVGIGLGSLAQIFGARQAQEYQFVAEQISGLGFLFWCMVLALFVMQGRRFTRENAFAVSAITFYLGTYFFVEVTARIFESALLIVLLTGLRLTGWRRMAFLSLIVAYGAIMYWLRLDKPWLGFGVT